MRLCHLLNSCCLGIALLGVASVRADLPRMLELIKSGRPDADGYQLRNAFPEIVFDQPVAMATPEAGRWLFVAERKGKLWCLAFENGHSSTTCLDLGGSTESTFIEAGLLGVACHPNFESNLEIYTLRTLHSQGFKLRLSKFRGSRMGAHVIFDPQSEETILEQTDLRDTHNGGHLEFGPDGYLYFGIGDEGPPPIQQNGHPQSIEGGLFAGVFRVDVDGRPGNLHPNHSPSSIKNYLVPADNPFVGSDSFLGKAVDAGKLVTEYYAVGFRNPWRFAFHSPTGALLAGDVGAGAIEEINMVVSGKNYGWPYREGHLPGKSFSEEPSNFAHEPPAIFYNHGYETNQGNAVIAGHFYRGANLPLTGDDFLFADYSSGNIWKSRLADAKLERPQWLTALPGITTFGVHPISREPLVADLHTGRVWMIEFGHATPPPPRLLSETELFEGLSTLVAKSDLVAYQIREPFWSDHAVKRRWVSISASAQPITLDGPISAKSASGTLWVKHFDMEMERGNPNSSKPLETRLLWNTMDGFKGLSYRWNSEGTDAELVPAEGASVQIPILHNGIVTAQSWSFPSRTQCASCHTEQAGGVLGFNLAQLNVKVPNTRNELVDQVNLLDGLGVLTGPNPQIGDRLALSKLSDDFAPMEHRLRSFIQVNCSQCHQPGTWARSIWDGRITTPFDSAQILNGPLLGPRNANDRVLRPGHPEDSMMLYRVSQRDAYFMPPIGSTVPASQFVNFLSNYVARSTPSGLIEFEIGDPHADGSVEMLENGSIAAYGSGSGFGESSETLHFAAREMSAYSSMALTLLPDSIQGGTKSGGGLMVRASQSAEAPFVFVGLDPAGAMWISHREEIGAKANRLELGKLGGSVEVRAHREHDELEVVLAETGKPSPIVFRRRLAGNDRWLGGIGVYSGENQASFASLTTPSRQHAEVTLSADFETNRVVLPASLRFSIATDVAESEVQLTQMSVNGDQVFAVETNGMVSWKAEVPGSYTFRALVSLRSGLQVRSNPLSVEVEAPPSQGYFNGLTHVDGDSSFGLLGTLREWHPSKLVPIDDIIQIHGMPGLPDPLDWTLPAFRLSDGELETFHWPLTSASRLSVSGSPASPSVLTLALANPNVESLEIGVSINDTSDGRLLDQRSFALPFGHSLLSISFLNSAQIDFTTLSGLGILKGIALDFVEPPKIEWKRPSQGTMVSAGDALEFDFEVVRGAEDLTGFDAYRNGILWTNFPPDIRSFTVDPALAGVEAYWLVAKTRWGEWYPTEIIQVEGIGQLPKAVYLNQDAATKGNWLKHYGSVAAYGFGGFGLPEATVRIKMLDARNFTFYYQPWSDDSSALRLPGGDQAIAACVVSGDGPLMDIELADGSFRVVTMYFADFNGSGRATQVLIRAKSTGEVLDSRVVEDFALGKHLSWLMRGNLEIQLVPLSGNAIVSGVFVDGHELSYTFWKNASFSEEEIAAGLANQTADPDGDGMPNLVEFALSSDPKIQNSPYSLSINGDFGEVSISPNPAAEFYRVTAETSTDLLRWDEIEWEPSPSPLRTHPFRLSESNSKFFRLRVVAPDR